MQIKTYLDGLLNKVSANPHVVSQSISFEERPPDAAYITGTITFIDGSKLHIKEFLIFKANAADVVKYGYHYLSGSDALIFRYDNALDPKARDLSTYPEHKHTSGGLADSQRPPFEDMLQEISDLVGRSVKQQ